MQTVAKKAVVIIVGSTLRVASKSGPIESPSVNAKAIKIENLLVTSCGGVIDNQMIKRIPAKKVIVPPIIPFVDKKTREPTAADKIVAAKVVYTFVKCALICGVISVDLKTAFQLMSLLKVVILGRI